MAIFQGGPNILVVGSDRISRRLVHELGEVAGLKVFEDRSTSLSRVARLVWRRSLRLSDVMQMVLAEARRERLPAVTWISGTVTSNEDLLKAIRQIAPRRVLLFRAGLIVNRDVLAEGVDILNIHCASIRTHGGLASIRRALEDRACDQVATLHRVTTGIDAGEELAVKPYRLDPSRSYFWNEEAAYAAGIALTVSLLHSTDTPSASGADPD